MAGIFKPPLHPPKKNKIKLGNTRKRNCLELMPQIDIFKLSLNVRVFSIQQLYVEREKGLKCSVVHKILLIRTRVHVRKKIILSMLLAFYLNYVLF